MKILKPIILLALILFLTPVISNAQETTLEFDNAESAQKLVENYIKALQAGDVAKMSQQLASNAMIHGLGGGLDSLNVEQHNTYFKNSTDTYSHVTTGELYLPVKVTDNGKLGVGIGQLKYTDLEKLGYYNLANIEYSFAEAIPAGWNKSWKTLTDYVKQLKKIFNPSTGAYKGLGGFKAIMDIFPTTWSWQAFWEITAFLSIMLGFMNLLPIPALDGGHVVFTLWEMITGKKPGDKFLEYAQVTGFILLIALLLFANGNDIFRLFK